MENRTIEELCKDAERLKKSIDTKNYYDVERIAYKSLDAGKFKTAGDLFC